MACGARRKATVWGRNGVSLDIGSEARRTRTATEWKLWETWGYRSPRVDSFRRLCLCVHLAAIKTL